MNNRYLTKQNRRFIIWSIILFGIIELAFVRFALPSYYTHYLLFIPVWFLLMGVLMIMILQNTGNKNVPPGRMLSRLILFSIVRMVLSFIVIFLYYYLVNIQRNTVLLSFAVFYLFFMGIEIYILFVRQK